MKTFSIIIPIAEGEKYSQTLNAVKKFDYPATKIEVITVHGNQPARQRNKAAQKAKGDILYFLDNDSIPHKNNLNIINKIFKNNKDIAVTGGPSLPRSVDTLFQKAISIAFASFIGTSFSRSRYSRIGKPRISNDLELILCNMAIRRDLFLKIKGFNPLLYPNEENEMINRIIKLGKKVFYHPDIVIYRSPRTHIFKLIKQIFIYGRGRGQQSTIHLSHLTLFPLISLGFDLYLILLIIFHNKYLFIPGILYLIIIASVSLIKAILNKNLFYFLCLPIIFFIIHFFYGVGFLYGIIKSWLKIKIKKTDFWYKTKWIKRIK